MSSRKPSQAPSGPHPHLLKRCRVRASQRMRSASWVQPRSSHPYTSHLSFVHNGNSPTCSSVCRQVSGPSKGPTMSLVTGSLLGKLERRWNMTGLTPFRYWYPKKWSSHQCSVTYSREQRDGGVVGLETTSLDPAPAQPFAHHYGLDFPLSNPMR